MVENDISINMRATKYILHTSQTSETLNKTQLCYYLNLWTFADMAKSPQCFPRGSPVYAWYALEDYILQILHLCKMDSRRITSRIWCWCRNTTANNIFWLPQRLELARTCFVRRFETKKHHRSNHVGVCIQPSLYNSNIFSISISPEVQTSPQKNKPQSSAKRKLKHSFSNIISQRLVLLPFVVSKNHDAGRLLAGRLRQLVQELSNPLKEKNQYCNMFQYWTKASEQALEKLSCTVKGTAWINDGLVPFACTSVTKYLKNCHDACVSFYVEEKKHTQLKQVEFTKGRAANPTVSSSRLLMESCTLFHQPVDMDALRRALKVLQTSGKKSVEKKMQRRDTTKFKHIKSREWRQLAKCFNFEGLGLFVGGHSETTDSPHPNPTPLPSCLQPRLWQILPVESLGNGWLWEGLTGGT